MPWKNLIKGDVHSLKEDQKEFQKNNKLIWKRRQRFRSEKRNVFTKEINKTALRSNEDKTIDSIETYAPGTSKDLICNKKNVTI